PAHPPGVAGPVFARVHPAERHHLQECPDDHGVFQPLMDNGHYHPTEVVSGKISALLLFNEKIALHVTRPVRWDSDHVVLFDDETKEIAKEIVRNDALDRVFIATDYFDASINRISALATGYRSWQKALLEALCTPFGTLKELQDTNQLSKKMVMQEAVKLLPLGEIWDEYLRREGVVDDFGFYDEIEKYEKDVLLKR
ncbi:MAG: L-rhamnose isomerase, partial [Lachnospiraceae bacterium]|nr:L-rhamnose isomerase [Lachnospiraceae bacterium]